MEKIDTLDLSHTAIKTLPESIEKLVALERLCMSDYSYFRQLDLKTLYLDGCKHLQEIRKIPPNIEVFFARFCEFCTSSSIRVLSKQYCYNLRKLDLSYNENLEEILDISGAANLEVLNVRGCSNLTKIDDFVGQLAKLRVLIAENCNKLDTFIVGGIKLVSLEILTLHSCSKLHTFPEILVIMEKIKILDLSYTAIKTLPESIEKLVALEALCLTKCIELRQLSNLACRDLKRLDLEGCEQLQEIRGIPTKIEVFSARNCTSLTSCTRRLLLSQELHENGNTQFFLPGKEIPKWFHKHSTGVSVSFWVRKELPRIASYAVLTDGPETCESFMMIINGTDEFVLRTYFFSQIETDHIFLVDLGEQGRDFEIGRDLLEEEWNHVEVSWEDKGTESRLKCIGVYVYNYDSSTKDILFENPIPQKRIPAEVGHQICDSNLESSSVYCDNSRDLSDNSEEDLQQQQISKGSEIVKKTKGNDIIVHGGNANDEKDKIALEVTCQNCLRSSNNESLTWDPMIWEYGLTRQKDQSTLIDKGHDGWDPMEWEYQLTHLKDQSTIIGDKSKNEIMGPSTEVVSSTRKKEINLKVDAVDRFSFSPFLGPSSQTSNLQLSKPRTTSDLLLSDLQQQQHLSYINQQVLKSSENVKNTKGKDIIVYGDNANEEKGSNTLEKDQSTINDKGHDEMESYKARVTCFDLFSYLVSLCSSSAAS